MAAAWSGGVVTVSAVDVGVKVVEHGFDYEENVETETILSSEVLNGLVAGSVDNGATWSFGGVALPYYYFNLSEFEVLSGSGGVCRVDGSMSVTPTAVVIPSGAVLVGSSRIALGSGRVYEMRVANGGIVMGERFAPEVSE